MTALVGAGLGIEWLREHARTPYPFPEFLEERERRRVRVARRAPVLFSLAASLVENESVDAAYD